MERVKRMYLVTGGCGFIGSHLVRALMPRGKRIVVIDNMQFGNPGALPENQVELIKFNIGVDDPTEIADKIAGVTHVFHLAAEKHNQSKMRPNDVFRANVDGMHQLLEAVIAKGAQKIVFTSSLYAYGRMSGEATRESDPLKPTTTYGVSKLCGEELMHYFARRYGVSTNVLRLYFIYGPRQYVGMGYKSVIVKNFERILRGEAPVIFGDGMQALDYLYVDDTVDALLRTMDGDYNGEVFNISTGEAHPVKEVIETMMKVAGSSATPIHDPPDETAGSRRVGSSNKARSVLQWQPKVSLEEGLAKTFDWIKEQHQQ